MIHEQTRRWSSFGRSPRNAFRGDSFWSEKVSAVVVAMGPVAVVPGNDRLYLEEFDLYLPRAQAYFLDGMSEAQALKAHGARFHHDADGRLLCVIAGITVIVRDLEEMQILQETFVDGTYDFALAGPSLVWDIGMNVGITSLYFAARGDVRVVGYEPIGPTYEMARENLDLNPALRGAITAIHSGVGGWDRTEMVDYCPQRKGSVGLRGAVSDPVLRRLVFHLPVDTVMRKESLRLENAVSVFRAIREAHPDLPVIGKIDCEGAEYEIIEALYHSGDLRSFHALMIEWHRDGPAKLREWLTEAGFTVFAPSCSANLWGRMYAVRGEAHTMMKEDSWYFW